MNAGATHRRQTDLLGEAPPSAEPPLAASRRPRHGVGPESVTARTVAVSVNEAAPRESLPTGMYVDVMETETTGGSGRIDVGTCGWAYAHWRGPFYPHGLPTSEWLGFYAQRFASVEIDSTFYRLPSEEAIQRWLALAPEGFNYAVKMNRRVTHLRRLRGAEEATRSFVARVAPLDRALGAYLVQLPPGLTRDVPLLDGFLASLQAAQAAAPGPAAAAPVAVEFRHPSWFDDDVYGVLRDHHAAFCISDLGGRLWPLVATARLVYVRLHGPERRYAGSYGDEALAVWAERCRAWAAAGRHVRVYFDNDELGYATADALRLGRLLA